MTRVFEFPNYYKKCPECGNTEINFIEQDIISIKRVYQVKNGEINSKFYKTVKVESDHDFPFYSCGKCDWVNFGGTTWNKKEGR